MRKVVFQVVIGDEFDIDGEVSRVVAIEDDPLLGTLVTLAFIGWEGQDVPPPVVVPLSMLEAIVDAYDTVWTTPVAGPPALGVAA